MYKLATFSGITPKGEPLNRIFRPGDSIRKVAGTMMPQIQEWLSSYVPEPGKIAVLVNAMGASEYWGQNVNGDIFPENSLVHDCRNHGGTDHPYDDFTGKVVPPYGYWTFLQAYPFVHHKNKDPNRAFGKVVVATWNPRMHRVELVIIIDKELALQHGAQHVVDRILAGEFPDVSMGCFKRGTRIVMADATLKHIEDVEEGDEVMTHLGVPRKVTDTMVRRHTGSIFRLKAYAQKEMFITDEHPLWLVRKSQVECCPSSKKVNRGRKQRVCTPESLLIKKGCEGCTTKLDYKFEWVRTDEADEGDYLAMPVPNYDTDVEISVDEARLLGYYLAEGHLLFTKAGNLRGIQFSTGMEEQAVHKDLESLADRLGVSEGFSFANVPERNACYISLWGIPELADLCATHCGSGAKIKKLSQDLMAQSPEVLKAFLGAYANGDGGAYEGSLYLSTASEDLAANLAFVSAKCGMVPSVSTIRHKPGPKSVVNVETIEHRVWVGTDTSWKLNGYTERPLSPSKRINNKRFFVEKDGHVWLLTPIESIDEESYDDDVYNFSVEGHESYVAEGCAVHNCKVPYDICTICGHKSKTRHDYCTCITQFGMGKLLDDGRRVGVINTYPRFFDISFVFIGADKTAKVMCKLASGLYVPASVFEGEEIYGVDEGEELVKAASVQVPRNIFKVAEPRIAGMSLAESDSLLQKGPPPTLLFGKTDAQLASRKRAISDGALRTNADVNETEGGEDEKESPLYPSHGDNPSDKTAAKVAFDLKKAQKRLKERRTGLDTVWRLAKQMKIGPPPKPNRKEHPFTGTIDFRGLMIHVENKPGTYREGKGWKTLMRIPYGEFLGTRGVDKDKLDVYVGPFKDAPNVYIVHQNFAYGRRKGKYDEDKVMVGFDSAEQAKQAYLAHYDSPEFFRSITTMAFPVFKRAIMKKEVHGEKVATELTGMLEKTAGDMKLEDLFHSKNARKRQKMWRDKVTGRETKAEGSGFESMEKAKTAAVSPDPNYEEKARKWNIESAKKTEKARAKLKAEGKKPPTLESLFGRKPMEKKAEPLSPRDLLRVSNDEKTASQLKWADIVKEIGPDKAVGRVSPLLSDTEPSMPRDTLNALGGAGIEKGLTTPSMAGMVLKPDEFQRIMLTSMGKCDLADKLDEAGAQFKPSCESAAPCGPLGPEMMDGDLLQKILPMLRDKSYFGPPLRARIIRITIVKPPEKPAPTEVDSPLLSKVAAAYTWYRREQMKLAADAPQVISEHPQLHAGLYGLGDADLFKSAAAKGRVVVNPKTLGVILGSVPLTLMYSAHLRGKQRQGEELGMLKTLVADHPWLATLGTAATLKKVMDTPQAQQTADEMLAAAGRIWRGKGAPQANL